MHAPIRTLYRQLRARPRLLISCLVGLVLYPLLPQALASRTETRFLLSWNAAVGLYLLLSAWMVAHATHETMRRQAQRQDEGQRTVLLLTILAALTSLVAIVAELGAVKDLSGALKGWHVALAAATVASSWLFTHLMFALHYAHDYYLNLQRGQPAGLEFPGNDTPDYGDFLYFAGVIGTSGQTADVSLASRSMRRTGLVHCVLSFFFNTTVLALSINIGAGLI